MLKWQQILSQHGPPAWRAALRITGSASDADDCLQDALIDALELARSGTRIRNWGALLRRLATTRALDRVREKRRRAAEAVADWGELAGVGAPMSRGLEEAELAERLRDALGKISSRQAEVFCLHCLEGFRYEEIAQQLNVSVGVVSAHLHRAREKLRRLLAGVLDVPRDLGAAAESGSRSRSR
jgi:RNA polymerase sigma-70 factor (ECF subfamily)